MSFTAIADIGRFTLLQSIRSSARNDNSELSLGIGDDSAILRPAPHTDVVFSSETLIEGIDFDLSWHPLRYLGYKLVTIGISDIIAMAATPKAILVNLSLTTKFSVEMVTEFYDGIREACDDYGCDLAGGDMRSAQHSSVIAITALGSLTSGSQILKTTANPGDALCVSGTLGEAYAGLKILLREKKFWMDHPDETTNLPSEWKSCIATQLVPKARIDILSVMREKSLRPTAMADLSKGLLNELVEMCKLGNHGAYVYEAALPISEQTQDVAIEMNEQAIAYALQGGEDYQLLFTMDQETLDRAFEYIKDITVIGMIRPTSEGLQLQKFNGDVWTVDLHQAV